MADLEIEVKFSSIKSIIDLNNQISSSHNLRPGQSVFFKIDLETPDMVYPENLALMVAIINHLKATGVKVNGNVRPPKDPNKYKYIARIDFYKQLNIHISENFKRNNSSGRFVEITSFDKNNLHRLSCDIIKVINESCKIDESVLAALSFCLSEIMDNVDSHANSPIGGLVAVQNYKYNRQLRIIIIDTGMGIHRSLTEWPGSEFANLTEEQAVQQVLNKGVTKGTGAGNGLYLTKNFIEENEGELILCSGNYHLHVSRNQNILRKSSPWQGTFLFLKIQTDKVVDFKKIMGLDAKITLKEDLEFFLSEDNELW